MVKIIKPRPGAPLTKIDIRGGASDFFNLDNKNSITEEYTVIKFIMHPGFDPKRLTNDLGILIVDRPIQLSSKSGVNAACYPQCKTVFYILMSKKHFKSLLLKHFNYYFF